MAVQFQMDTKPLKNLKDFLSANYRVKIGVLGSDASKKRYPDDEDGKKTKSQGISAVELAATHEFGSDERNIPPRSFLRKTYHNYSDKFQASVGMKLSTIEKYILSGNGEQWLNKVGAQWVQWVQDTFKAQGPGWPPHSKRYASFLKRTDSRRQKGNKLKKTWPLLNRTGAMLRSITHEVKRGR